MENIKRCRLYWGENEHEKEYLLIIFSKLWPEADEIPQGWERRLANNLPPKWDVADRGFRVEIRPPDLTQNQQTDEQVKTAVLALIGPEYEFITVGFLDEENF